MAPGSLFNLGRCCWRLGWAQPAWCWARGWASIRVPRGWDGSRGARPRSATLPGRLLLGVFAANGHVSALVKFQAGLRRGSWRQTHGHRNGPSASASPFCPRSPFSSGERCAALPWNRGVQLGSAAPAYRASLTACRGVWVGLCPGCWGPGCPWGEDAVGEGGVKLPRVGVAAKQEKSCSALCTKGW